MSLAVTYWDVGSITTLLSTELNSLASAASVVSSVGGTSGVFSNIQAGGGVGGFPQGILQLTLGSPGGTLTAGTSAFVWFLLDIDGTNFEDGSSSVTPARAPDAILAVRNASGAQILTSGAVPLNIPPNTWKVLLQQSTGQTWAASGNTLKLLPVTNQIG